MDQLIELLVALSTCEYAQWMRYTYLSALGFGFNTDQLTNYFNMHSYSALDHAKTINRWIVDLGDMPPTNVPSVDQYVGSTEGAIEWLINAEIESIEMYNITHAIAGELEIAGLQYDLGRILSNKHENLSNFMDLVEPHTIDDVTILVLGSKLNKFAKNNLSLYEELIINRFVELNRIAAETSALDINTWLREMIDLGRYGALELENNDIEKLQTTLPERTREWIINDIEDTVKNLWSRRQEEDVTSAMEFYREVYEWLNSPQIVKEWPGIFESYIPDWKTWLLSDWYEQKEPGSEPDISMEDIFQQIKPSESTTSPVKPKREERPIVKEIEKKLMVFDPDTKKKDLEVGIGDRVFSQLTRDILKANKEDYGLTPQQINAYSVGTIKEIRSDGSIIVTIDGAEDPFDEQIWSQEKLWGSRESGQRVVN